MRLEWLNLVDIQLLEWNTDLFLLHPWRFLLTAEQLCGRLSWLLLLDLWWHRLVATKVEVQIEIEILVHIELLRLASHHHLWTLLHLHGALVAIRYPSLLLEHRHLLRDATCILICKLLLLVLLLLHFRADVWCKLDACDGLNKLQQLELVLDWHGVLDLSSIH